MRAVRLVVSLLAGIATASRRRLMSMPGKRTTGRPIKYLLAAASALIVGPGMLLVAPPSSIPAAYGTSGTVLPDSTTISANTTWSPAGSPYWIQGMTRVAAGVRLTIEPGTVVKIGNPSNRYATLQINGQLIAQGTLASPITFTSAKDDSIAGDTNGDGTTTSPAPGDWYSIRLSNSSSPSVIDRAVVQYGGYGSGTTCAPYGEVSVETGAILSVTNSDFLQAHYNGVSVESGTGDVRLSNNKFADSGCGIFAARGVITENIFESTLSKRSAEFQGPTGAKFYDNYAAKGVYIYGGTTGSTRQDVDVRGNALLGGVVDMPSTMDPQDLSNNWWGRVLEDPPTGCYDWNATYIPAVTTMSTPACTAIGKLALKGYFTKVLPALTQAPPMPSAGVSGVGTYAGSVDAAQTYGPDGGSEYAASPTGSQADPVNTATGALTHSESDLAIASQTSNLAVSRFYTSADTAAGPFGPGWSLGYDIRLTVQGTDAVLKSGTGQRIKFTETTNGTFAAPTGATSSLVRNPNGSFTLATRSGLTHTFDAAGRLTALTDGSGRGPTYTYDGGGRLTQVNDGSRSISFTWDTTGGRITGAQTSAGQSVNYSYTGGLLTGATNALSGTTTYTYDSAQRLTEIKAPSGTTHVRTAYDTSTGRVSDQWDGLNNHSTFSWDATTSTATMTDPRGGIWKDVYLGNVLQRRIDAVGNATSYEYDPQLRLIATLGPDGVRSAITYTAGGDIKSYQGRSTGQVTTDYNAQHLPTTTINPRGYTSTQSYDAANNLTQLSRPNPAGGTINNAFGYDAMGNVTSATDPNGNISAFEFSTNGDPTKATSPLGSMASMSYDSSGRLTGVVSPRGNVSGADPDQFRWQYEYDTLGRLTKATNPAGQYESVEYNADSQVTKSTDLAGRSTTYQYDAAGHVTSVQGPDLSVPPITAAHDANGNVTTVTDTMGRTTTYQYDAANRATSVTNPLGSVTFTYTARNQIATVKDAQNNLSSYGYDNAGRVLKADLPGSDSDVTYTYDANGNRTKMVDPNGTTTYAYDSLDRLTTVTRGGRTFTLGYDAGSRLTTLTSPDGATTGYAYDADGRITQVKKDTTVLASYTHDAEGNILTVTRGDGSQTNRSYNNLGQLTHITDTTAAATILDETYAYTASGNLQSITRPDGSSDNFSYDTLDRLTKACYGAACASSAEILEWTYDNANNILTEIRNNQTITHSYNTKGQLTQTSGPAGSTNYTYDTKGQTLTAGSTSFTYTRGGRTATATTAAGTTTYKYDGDGRRLSAALGSTKNTFEWDPFYRLANELDVNGALVRHYTQGDQPLTAHDATGAAAYFHTDRLGSVRAVTDSSGAVTSAGAWEPYGRPRATGPNNPNAPPLGWMAQYQDPTGLTHLRARQYDPITGIFRSTDPAAATIFSATYTYGSANPLRFRDITGLDGWDWNEFLNGVADVSGIVSEVAGWVAVGCAVTVVLAGCAAIAGGISLGAGAIHAGATAIQAYNTCTGGKGSCGDAVAEAVISTASILPGVKQLKGASSGLKALTGSGETALYQKLSASGQHLKYGIANNPATRYTQKQLAGGKLNILATGPRQDMLALERSLHETLPIGPEEKQLFYIQIQINKGLRPPPYPW